MQRTRAHLFDQAPDEGWATVLTDLISKPQSATDHHRQGYRRYTALFLDADIVRLHLPEVSRSLEHLSMHGLAVETRHSSAKRPPSPRRNQRPRRWLAADSRGRARSPERHGLDRRAQPIDWSPFGYSEAPAALSAAEALVLPRVDARVALTGFRSGRAAQIRQNVDVGP